ncbi:MAG: hypothetical protein WCW66_04410 [Patescibacteria group bacterium]|jgi:hypothetical protein
MNKFTISIIIFFLGIGCLVAFMSLGSRMTGYGNLDESPWLLTVGFILIVIGMFASVWNFDKRKSKGKKKVDSR